VAIGGTVTYGGTEYSSTLISYQYFVGAFRVATFDTSQGFPDTDYETDGESIVGDPKYVLGQFDNSLDPDTWYVGAFLDVNFNRNYDPDIDPAEMSMIGEEFGAV
jgi:hypothetical protein